MAVGVHEGFSHLLPMATAKIHHQQPILSSYAIARNSDRVDTALAVPDHVKLGTGIRHAVSGVSIVVLHAGTS
jgi:hypothetical protein